MSQHHRSECPINLAVEVLGDRWTLLVLRDIMFAGRRHFRALLEGSEEGISPSVLSDRLQSLVSAGLLVKENCPTHRQKGMYRLTASGADLVPLMAQLGAWGARHCGCDEAKARSVLELEKGGDAACCAVKARLLEMDPEDAEREASR